MRVLFEQTQHLLVFRDRAEGEHREIHHQEILVLAADVGRKPVTRNADHLDRETARGRNLVRMDIARRGRKPRDDLVGLRRSEDALRKLSRQTVLHGHATLKDRVRFRMGIAMGVPMPFERVARRRIHLFDDLARQPLFVGIDLLDIGGEPYGLHGQQLLPVSPAGKDRRETDPLVGHLKYQVISENLVPKIRTFETDRAP